MTPTHQSPVPIVSRIIDSGTNGFETFFRSSIIQVIMYRESIHFHLITIIANDPQHSVVDIKLKAKVLIPGVDPLGK